jgi:hypothetical protein
VLRKKAALVALSLVTAAASAAATGASQAAVRYNPSPQDTVYALAPDDSYVAEWMGLSSGWTVIGGPAKQVYAGSAGVFELDASGNIWMYNGTPYSWTEVGGPGAEFAEGAGHLYGLGPNDAYVAEWNGTPNSWTIIGGPAKHIYAGPDGLVATAPDGSTGDVWKYSGTPNDWTDIGGPGDDFAVGVGAVYRVGIPSAPGITGVTTVSVWTGGTTWTPIFTSGPDDTVDDLLAGYAGVYLRWVSDSGGGNLEYNGTPDSWTKISDVGWGSPFPDAESRTSLYAIVTDTTLVTNIDAVDIYNGTGTSWTVIGGPADIPLAAGD